MDKFKSFKSVLKTTSLGSFIVMIILGYISCGAESGKGFKTSSKSSLLWEITGNRLFKPSCVYGTIHFYDTSVFHIPKQVYSAIDNCNSFALEVDMSTVDPFVMAQRILITSDTTLDMLLKPEVYNEVIEMPFIKLMGEKANKTKPLFLSAYILVDNPMAMQSVDMSLYQYAQDINKNIFGIETIEDQLDMADAIPLQEQADDINV